jgi:hypothetical protein
VALEGVHMRRPVTPERREPGIYLHERFWSDSIKTALGIEGCGNFRLCSISPTDRSAEASRLKMARRLGSAMTAKVDSIVSIYHNRNIPVKAHKTSLLQRETGQ